MPGPTVTVTHDCTNEISVFVYLWLKTDLRDSILFVMHVFPNILTNIYIYWIGYFKILENFKLQNCKHVYS